MFLSSIVGYHCPHNEAILRRCPKPNRHDFIPKKLNANQIDKNEFAQ
jgi:hypothetical protein